MKNWIKAHVGLWILALMAVVVAGVMLLPRYRAESNDRTYDIVMEYRDLLPMSQQSEHTMDWWLSFLHEQGVENIALYECTIESLNKDMMVPVSYWKVPDLRKSAGWYNSLPESVAERVMESTGSYDFVVACYEAEDMDWIVDAMTRRVEDVDYVTGVRDGVSYLYVASSAKRELQKLPLGFWPEMVTLLRQSGMTILPRTTSVEGMNDLRFMESALAEFDTVNEHPAYFLPGGDGLLGYDEPEQAHDLLLSYLQRTGAVLTATEQSDQSGNLGWDGFDALCEETDYGVVRMFNEWPYVQNRYQYYGYSGTQEITNCLYRAVLERNCRVIYLRGILQTDSEDTYVVDPEAYTEMLSSIRERLEAQGMTQGTVQPIGVVAQPFVLRLLLGVGAIAAAVLLLCTVLPLRPLWQWILWGAGSLCVLGAMIVLPNGSKLLLSIGGGIAYPSLTMLCLLRALRGRGKQPSAGRIWIECIGGMLLCVLGSLCGALVTTAALSETAYMLEFRLYRAVKLMQLIPIGLYVLGYLILLLPEQLGLAQPLQAIFCSGPGVWSRLTHWLRRELRKPVELRWAVWAVLVVALLGVAGIGGIYYIGRTGNNGASVSTLELVFRNVLENRLAARPRTKEFLIGVPCLMLFIYLWRRGWKLMPFFVGLGLAIGMTSFVNTFLHLRAPLYLSFARTGYAVLFGLMIGALIIALIELLRAIRRKERKKRV